MGIEDSWHLFIGRRFAQGCWTVAAGLYTKVNQCVDMVDTLVDLVFAVLNSFSEIDKGKFVMLLWSIWRRRNVLLWQQIETSIDATINMALLVLADWLQVKKLDWKGVGYVQHTGGEQVWQRPRSSFLKCNVDASLFCEYSITSWGMVLGDENGSFIACRTITLLGIFNVKEAEAAGLYEALHWIRSMG
ncbi:hypothetical protein PTKIN_Ptkin18bG0076900 [Pterospermum kingtungense]